jgi:hypothetical protein
LEFGFDGTEVKRIERIQQVEERSGQSFRLAPPSKRFGEEQRTELLRVYTSFLKRVSGTVVDLLSSPKGKLRIDAGIRASVCGHV